ncbi:hypothetical protein [Allorhizocola rhizosphaerae]|uniref:hypothetical protein n=1 Tax=Allorhizocola rhizosphaerae TaxID=1872709 RepID=UPI000E3E84B8|nr:hypothetical protein [Allorhizocola rhizosphaerae]
MLAEHPDPTLVVLAVTSTVMWVSTIVALATMVVSISRLALTRARRQDVPAIVAGLGRILGALAGWLPSRGRGTPTLHDEDQSSGVGEQ